MWFQESFRGVFWKIDGCFRDILKKKSKGVSRKFLGVSSMFQGMFKSV